MTENSKVKAAILVAQRKPLVVDEIEVPELGVGQVLVKVAFSGICGKQLEEISGKRGEDPYIPHLLGHEGAGTVVEVGPGVRKVNAGDHVVLHWMIGSGIDSEPPRFRWKGTEVSAGWVTTFSEYTIASENRVTSIPKNAPLDVASLLGCAVTTGLGIVFNDAALMPGQSIAVFGVGGVGLNVLQGAALVNAHPIVAVDLHESKLEQAMAFGATHAINASKQDLESSLRDLAGPGGLDVAVDLTGDSTVREIAYNLTSNTGKTVLAGVPHHQERITIDSFPLHHGRRIIGSHGGNTQPDVDIPRYLKLYELGKLKLNEQITHRCCLDDINQGIALVQAGEAARCVVSVA